MRTTLDVDDAVLAAAKQLAQEMKTSIGAALSVLARRGLSATESLHRENGLPVFTAAADAPPITLEAVNTHRDG